MYVCMLVGMQRNGNDLCTWFRFNWKESLPSDAIVETEPIVRDRKKSLSVAIINEIYIFDLMKIHMKNLQDQFYQIEDVKFICDSHELFFPPCTYSLQWGVKLTR